MKRVTVFSRELVLGQEYLAFVLLNVLDLFLTGYIFRHHGMEANGVALWVLNTFQKRGFAIYKFVMVIFVIIVCELVATHNIARARWIIWLGVGVYVLVVLYESYLIFENISLPLVNPNDSLLLTPTRHLATAVFS